ncbi:hypothetical protein HY626_02055 [Candidatus Uhrbacteria bacterium]|nr:hypothetical protein [Candidatus Uhrbacteria bacterium]
MRFAEAWASAEWEIKYDQPQRVRETARAWVGMIELMVMGSSEGYAHAFNTPYQPPRTSVLPAAPEINLSEMGFSVTYLPNGSPFRFSQDHVAQVMNLFEGLKISRVPAEQYTRETTFPEDCVLVTWNEQGVLFHDPKYATPFNVFLLSPDGKERETSRITTRIFAAFPTEEAATLWVKTRAGELKAEHDRRHAQQCRDKVCARRGHTWQPPSD